jgi:hypothetical protein
MIKKILIPLLLITEIALAQNIPVSQSGNLEGRHGVELKIGIYDDTNVTSITQVSGLNSTVITNANIGVMGSLAYQYWIENYISFRLGVGALVTNADTKTSAGEEVSSEVSTVTPILTGVNFYPLQISKKSSILPYVSVYVGPYLGIYSRSEVAMFGVTQETIVETVIGTRLGAGIDFLMGNLFKLGLSAGYHFMGDFKRPIGSETNYSGPEYSLVFGFVF